MLLPLSGVAQSLSPSVHNYGKVKLWNNPRATFTFTNQSSNRVLFLPIPYQRNLYIHLPQGYIEPGETVELEAVFYTEDLGNFTVNQPLYLSGWADPVYLNLKGKIISFHPDAHTACPVMGQGKLESRSEIAKIIIQDKETGELLTGADILLVGTSHNYFVEQTRKTEVPLKKIPIGLYQIDVTRPGYMPGKQLVYINKQTQTIIVELERNTFEDQLVTIDPEIESGDEEDEVIEIEKPDESDQDAIERIRRKMDERFKGRRIIERDVMVVHENDSTDRGEERESEREQERESRSTEQGDDIFNDEIFDESSEDQTSRDTSLIAEVPDVEDTPDVPNTPDVPQVPKEDFSETGQLNPDKYASNNVVFLIDESSSMMLGDKMDMLQLSMKNVVEALRKEDMVTIIVYSRRAIVELSSTPGNEKERIYAVIDSLKPSGRSYGAEGLQMSYDYAIRNYISDGNNQIILATDGLFNSPNYTTKDMYEMAENYRDQGVLTTVVGFGRDKEAISFMTKLAQRGGGHFIKIKTQTEAEGALLTEIMQNALR